MVEQHSAGPVSTAGLSSRLGLATKNRSVAERSEWSMVLVRVLVRAGARRRRAIASNEVEGLHCDIVGEAIAGAAAKLPLCWERRREAGGQAFSWQLPVDLGDLPESKPKIMEVIRSAAVHKVIKWGLVAGAASVPATKKAK